MAVATAVVEKKKLVVKTLKVVAFEDEPVAAELLASQISAVAKAMERINKSLLTQEALVLLVSDASGMGKPAVRSVLDAMSRLGKTYLKRSS